MALIIEHVNRSGQAVAFVRCESLTALIGRGYDQTIILDDEYADAQHAKISLDNQTGELTCTDLGSANGVMIEPALGKKRSVFGVASIASGDVVVVGRTRLRIYRDNHVVKPARSLTFSHQLASALNIWPVAIVLLALLLFLGVLVSYIQTPVTENLDRYALESGYIALIVFALGGFWSLVGRTMRADGRLITHVMNASLALLFLRAFDFFAPWMTYHIPWQTFGEILSRALLGFLGCAFIYISLRTATRVRRLPAFAWSALVPLASVASVLIATYEQQDNVSQVPYVKTMVVPALNVRSSVTSTDFAMQANSLYSNVKIKRKPDL